MCKEMETREHRAFPVAELEFRLRPTAQHRAAPPPGPHWFGKHRGSLVKARGEESGLVERPACHWRRPQQGPGGHGAHFPGTPAPSGPVRGLQRLVQSPGSSRPLLTLADVVELRCVCADTCPGCGHRKLPNGSQVAQEPCGSGCACVALYRTERAVLCERGLTQQCQPSGRCQPSGTPLGWRQCVQRATAGRVGSALCPGGGLRVHPTAPWPC